MESHEKSWNLNFQKEYEPCRRLYSADYPFYTGSGLCYNLPGGYTVLITRVIPGLCYNLPGDYTVLITRFIPGLCSEACDMVTVC